MATSASKPSMKPTTAEQFHRMETFAKYVHNMVSCSINYLITVVIFSLLTMGLQVLCWQSYWLNKWLQMQNLIYCIRRLNEIRQNSGNLPLKPKCSFHVKLVPITSGSISSILLQYFPTWIIKYHIITLVPGFMHDSAFASIDLGLLEIMNRDHSLFYSSWFTYHNIWQGIC